MHNCHSSYFKVLSLVLLITIAGQGYARIDIDFLSAAGKGDIKALQQLLNEGATANTKGGKRSNTGLMEAAYRGQTEAVKFLISKGASVDAKNIAGETALIFAVRGGHTEIISLLINKGADVNAKATHNKTALMMAATSGRAGIASILIEKGADVNIKTTMDGETALMLAVQYGHADVVELLINKGADVNAKNRKEESALFFARPEIAEILINNRADVNGRQKIGSTPLVYAVIDKDLPLVKLLIAKGADVYIKDNHGIGVMHWAEQNHDKEMIRYLSSRMGAPQAAQPRPSEAMPAIATGKLPETLNKNRCIDSSDLIRHLNSMLVRGKDRDWWTPGKLVINGKGYAVGLMKEKEWTKAESILSDGGVQWSGLTLVYVDRSIGHGNDISNWALGFRESPEAVAKSLESKLGMFESKAGPTNAAGYGISVYKGITLLRCQ